MTDTPVSTDVSTNQMTIEEFVRLYDTEGAFEIIDGEIKPMSPTVAGHNYIAKIILAALIKYEQQTGVGEVFFETPYIQPDTFDSQWVKGSKVPDILFLFADRLRTYRDKTPDWKAKPLILIPDVIVEVVSQNDLYSDIAKKIAIYQDEGVSLIWIVDPQTEIISVHTQDGNQSTKLTKDNVLSGGDVLPRFELKLADIFA